MTEGEESFELVSSEALNLIRAARVYPGSALDTDGRHLCHAVVMKVQAINSGSLVDMTLAFPVELLEEEGLLRAVDKVLEAIHDKDKE